MKRTPIYAILALVMIVALGFTACQDTGKPAVSSTPASASTATASSTGAATAAAPKEPITFSVFSRITSTAPPATNKIEKKVQEATGVTLAYEFLVGDMNQKIGVMLAGGDYPDLVHLGGDAPQMLNAGAAIDVTDYIKNAPNLNAHFNEHNPLWGRRNIFRDGKIYVLETNGTFYGPPSQKEHNHYAYWLQKAVLSDAGYPAIPKTLEEYFALIKDYYAKNPQIDGVDTIPYDFSLLRGYGAQPQMWVGYPNDGYSMMWSQEDTTKYEGLAVYSDYSKQYLQKMNGFYRDGLIAEDSFTLTQDQYFARIATGAVVGTFNPMWYFKSPVNTLRNEGKYERTYIPCPLLIDDTRTQNYFDPRDVTGNNGVFISVKCKDPQRVIDFMDYIITEDAQKLLTWGIEGEDYKVGDDGMFFREADMDTNWRNSDWLKANSGGTMKGVLPNIEGWYSDGNCASWTDQPAIWKATLSDYDKKFLEAYNAPDFHAGFLRTTGITRAAYYPSWGSIILPPDSDELVVNQKLGELSKQYVPQLVAAPGDAQFESLWTEYWNKMTQANPQVLIDYLNKTVQDTQKRLLG